MVPDGLVAGPNAAPQKPLILITGATGKLGRSIGRMLAADYRVVGLDRDTEGPEFTVVQVDISNDASVELALRKVADEHGIGIASVIHGQHGQRRLHAELGTDTPCDRARSGAGSHALAAATPPHGRVQPATPSAAKCTIHSCAGSLPTRAAASAS